MITYSQHLYVSSTVHLPCMPLYLSISAMHRYYIESMAIRGGFGQWSRHMPLETEAMCMPGSTYPN